MRIISGDLGGRQFQSPPGHRTHPMSEKARGALFNALGDISGLSVLDAYSGSGALAFEAVSRGAKSAVAIEKSPQAFKTIKENIESLSLYDTVKATRANISSWLSNNPEVMFDLVLVDPPFDKLQPKILDNLVRVVIPGGTLVLSWPSSEPEPKLAELNTVQTNSYGDNLLIFFSK